MSTYDPRDLYLAFGGTPVGQLRDLKFEPSELVPIQVRPPHALPMARRPLEMHCEFRLIPGAFDELMRQLSALERERIRAPLRRWRAYGWRVRAVPCLTASVEDGS